MLIKHDHVLLSSSEAPAVPLLTVAAKSMENSARVQERNMGLLYR
jgi:hypothetical protein